MKTILLQLDTDPQPSVFDAVVAVDAGVDHLFRHGNVAPEQVRDLVYGGLFTRGPQDLKHTAVFIGGTDVARAEALLRAAKDAFFGPFRVSVLLDPNGANTTAAAAVLSAKAGFGGSLEGVKAAVLAATGPVGQRVARLLARQGAAVTVSSRKLDRAEAVARAIGEATGASLTPLAGVDADAMAEGLDGCQLIVSAGSAGVTLLPKSVRTTLSDLRVMIDLNAVPPLGIEGIEVHDRDADRDGVRTWGAIGVGGLKMKIHARAIRAMFEANDRILDAEEVFAIGEALG
ncbi:NADP-dependent methylenetetrahydromethanopterin/methylenetetrahydrofolate dehydrogenase [Tautonia rosea]|uniref:NADP-dependent methylenetetrahydromethanopterin/methylenetetrahydrofolate dehydrogenase n=1 Tax=Tautonia rosea TaxID=2728037 RepID=UPI0014744D99|nr:NADP-dependent methylenetetrahydromethanopterin/methylenetetrahydrofolate dehydrogenase [Tautonia rosea]